MPKIECLIRRAGGSKVTMNAPDREYHFAPSVDDSRHIADVDVAHHVKSLLRIKEGYRAVDDVDLDKQDDDGIQPAHVAGSKIHNASYVIKGGDTVELEDLVNMALEDSGHTLEDWNALADQDRYDFIDTTLKELQDGDHGYDEGQEKEPAAAPDDQSGDESKESGESDNSQDTSNGGDNTAGDVAQASTGGADQPDANQNGVTDSLEDMTRKDLIPLYVARFGREPSTKMKVEDIKRALSEDDD